MREVVYTDSIGRKFLKLIPNNAPDDHAMYGVLVGPPELHIELPESIHVRLHNELFARKIFTMRDVRRRREDIMSIVRNLFRLDCEVIAQCYKEWEDG